MKKLFSKLISILCIIYLSFSTIYFTSAEENISSDSSNIYPATIQQNTTNSSKNSKHIIKNFSNKIQSSYNNAKSSIKTNLAAKKASVNDISKTETVHNTIPDVSKNKNILQKVLRKKDNNITDNKTETETLKTIIPKTDKKSNTPKIQIQSLK